MDIGLSNSERDVGVGLIVCFPSLCRVAFHLDGLWYDFLMITLFLLISHFSVSEGLQRL